jgi:hypothetical protein
VKIAGSFCNLLNVGETPDGEKIHDKMLSLFNILLTAWNDKNVPQDDLLNFRGRYK